MVPSSLKLVPRPARLTCSFVVMDMSTRRLPYRHRMCSSTMACTFSVQNISSFAGTDFRLLARIQIRTLGRRSFKSFRHVFACTHHGFFRQKLCGHFGSIFLLQYVLYRYEPRLIHSAVRRHEVVCGAPPIIGVSPFPLRQVLVVTRIRIRLSSLYRSLSLRVFRPGL